MIRLIIKLAHKFKVVDSFLDKLLFSYCVSKNKSTMDDKEIKAILVAKAVVEIKRISEYEKHGKASGYEAPRIVGMGR